ncbi:hypothetical protein [Pseudobutyrivibrio sp.]
MDDMIRINGIAYLKEEVLIDAMVKCCVAFTRTDEVCVDQSEADLVNAFEVLLRETDFPKYMIKKFQNKYVNERFINRTI